MNRYREGLPLRVILGSVGRRVYLVRWFKEALLRSGVEHELIVTENSPHAAAYSLADASYRMPPYTDPHYPDAMDDLFSRLKPDLFLSLNDYELATLSGGITNRLARHGGIVLTMGANCTDWVTDKYMMARKLAEYGVKTPLTVLGSRLGDHHFQDPETPIVVKHRFGSGSSGLTFCTRAEALDAVESAARNAPIAGRALITTQPREDLVVVQERLEGPEFGVDGVYSLKGHTTRLLGVLARRKLAMRAGETDRAETVASEPFREILDAVGNLMNARGIIDIDVIRSAEGNLSVIDINPRFGGGYPFMHIAGADVPSLFIAELLGDTSCEKFLEYQVGVVGSKYEDIRVVG
jgi:carbamoyl-phosphate synthase large subunit